MAQPCHALGMVAFLKGLSNGIQSPCDDFAFFFLPDEESRSGSAEEETPAFRRAILVVSDANMTAR